MQAVNGANNADNTHNGSIISLTTYFLNLFMVPVFPFLGAGAFRMSRGSVRNLFLLAGAQAANGSTIITALLLLSRCRFYAP